MISRRVFLGAVISRGVFFGALSGGLLAAPGAIHAQPAAKVWRIGLLFPVEPRANRGWQSFEQGLRDLGYIQGRNVTFDYEFGHGEIGQPFADARNLVRLNVDLIVTLASGAVAAKEATTTTPIVALAMADAVESGLVASLARPGGNITGMSLPYSELAAKRLEILKGALPHLQRVALLTTGSRVGKENELRAMTSAARSLGLKLEQYERRRPRDLDRAFADMKAARVEALVVSSELTWESHRIASLAISHRVPSIGSENFAERGGLISYSASLPDLMRRAATYVDKILKGAKPAELPVEQPTTFELIVNMKTAKALGVSIPRSLLSIADEVIE